MPTGKYPRTPEMLANYSRGAKNRKYSPDGLKKMRESYYRQLEKRGGKTPSEGKTWKIDPKIIEEKWKGRVSPNKGIPATPEQKEKNRNAGLKRMERPGEREKLKQRG